MKYKNFIKNVKTYMESQFQEGQKVLIQPVLKNNGTVYDGLIIIDPILNISPTIYLNPYYHRFLDGVSMEDIYSDILSTYHENLPKEDFDISLFKDFDKAKERILVKLVNQERNSELLEEVPHIIFHDLAIIFVCAICDFLDEYATILIHNQHLEMWGISLDELYEIGMENTPKLLPYSFDSMENVLKHLSDGTLPFVTDIAMSVLTNQLKIHGATSIIYPGLLKRLANDLDDDIIIIPSSIHEVLIIPYQSTISKYSLLNFRDMIVQVNEEQLPDEEVLSDHAYLYLKDSEKLIY